MKNSDSAVQGPVKVFDSKGLFNALDIYSTTLFVLSTEPVFILFLF
jgi:hypothetical protein